MDESILLDLLECPVCLERLDASAKVLPCQHTFCRRCLQGILGSRGELRCPECRTLVECGVDELPSNILLVRLLDGIKQRPRMSASVGGVCMNGTSGAVARAHGSGMRDQGNPGVQPQRTQAKSTAVRVPVGPCFELLWSLQREDWVDEKMSRSCVESLECQCADNA
ncbi:E3 ubiquitin-protein ligase sh3rf1 [Characodon lateralis]|uniref:E3 ubiquitin-protein ligase sh3rf1 n=1 Tax=Characodon lateralis TaxID=208331 RepID=A0ABU7EJJ3_9TELE|nr:E3 ubiquitin-protein ligase sh3rf1 [Characodon lateralis]